MKVRAKNGIHNHVYDEFDNQQLTPDNIYDVIGISSDNYRVIDDKGEPILYPKYLFDVIDPTIQQTWIKREFSENEYLIDPPELCKPGFYEDYFDANVDAKAVFEKFKESNIIQN